MYWRKLNLNLIEKLTCKVCKMFYLEPVTLQCGKNICKHHIIGKLTANNNLKVLKCELCNMNHHIPENGFKVNSELMDLINLNMHVDEKTKKAHKIIEELEKVQKKLEFVKDPENFIHEYVSETKNKIDLKKEQFKLNIDNIHEDLINKVNNFEKECKDNLKKSGNLILMKPNYSQIIQKLTEESKNELRNPKIEDETKNKIINELSSSLKKEKENLFEQKNKILNGKGCFFDVSNFELEQNCFGELFIDEFKKTDKLNQYGRQKLDDKTILTPILSRELIKLCEFSFTTEFKLIYRASRDGFSSQSFHSKCDNIPKTLTIIKVKDKPHIFGGYTEATWDGNEHKLDPNAFIFSLVNDDKTPLKLKTTKYCKYSIYCLPSHGPCFGFDPDYKFDSTDDYDLRIPSYSNCNYIHSNSFGKTYPHPFYVSYSEKARHFLAGADKFLINEIEVYQVQES